MGHAVSKSNKTQIIKDETTSVTNSSCTESVNVTQQSEAFCEGDAAGSAWVTSCKRQNFMADEDLNSSTEKPIESKDDKKASGKERRKLSRRSSKIGPTTLPDAEGPSSKPETVPPTSLPDEGPSSKPEPVSPPNDMVLDGCLNATDLYNTLNDFDGTYLYDPAYLILIDGRSEAEYERTHIVGAIHHSQLGNATMAHPVTSYDMVVLYNTNGGIDTVVKGIEDAIKPLCGDKFHILSLGMDAFESQYPCMCTAEIVELSANRRTIFFTYPSCVLEKQLYLGTGKQATHPTAIESLKLTHILNLGSEHPNAFPKKVKYHNVKLADDSSSDIKTAFHGAIDFVARALESNGIVLIHCNLGISRSSTVTLAYFMKEKRWTLKDAYSFLKARRSVISPNLGFVEQLLQYEFELFGSHYTDIKEL